MAKKDSAARRITALGLIVTLGIVFGDIGTSPLYVMKTICGVTPGYDADYILGAVSLVFWTLTLQTTVKYVLIALRADNKGEGGILALYSLVRSKGKKWLYLIASLGAATLIADGVITPAITVTTSIEGLSSVMADPPVIPLTLLIIAVIFFAQRFGTSAIGRCFGPFMLAWFLMLGVLGVCNIGWFPGIMKAFNPWYAVRILIDYPGWFLVLGAVFLCTTGAEALYSDLGHCGRWNISAAWIFVKVMLVLNYLGQGAWILAHPDAVASGVNPFYGIMPGWFVLVGIFMSAGASIIASQALISGSFTIFSEAINLNFWPRLRIKYPSTAKGQLYIPAVNTCLFLGCAATVLIFRSSANMEGAYGLAITVTMLMTTVLLTFWMLRNNFPRWATMIFLTVFAGIESVFLCANLFKFMHGGWYTMLIALAIVAVIYLWYNAGNIRRRYVQFKDIRPELDLIAGIADDREIPKTASNLVYISYSDSPDLVETKILYSIINKSPKRADHYWFIRVSYTDEPYTMEYTADDLIPGRVFSIGLKFGFRIAPRVNVHLREVIEDLVSQGRVNLVSRYPSLMERNIPGDFRFIILHRVFSPSSNCRPGERILMSSFERLRHLGTDTPTALDLDTSNISTETVPLILSTASPSRRIRPAGDPDADPPATPEV